MLELDLLYALRATFAANDIHLWSTGVLTPPPPRLFTCRIGYCRLSLRFNNVSFCEGAGVRLGGWEIDGHQYGQNNSVSLHRNQTYSKRYCPIHALTTRAAIEEALLFFGGGGIDRITRPRNCHTIEDQSTCDMPSLSVHRFIQQTVCQGYLDLLHKNVGASPTVSPVMREMPSQMTSGRFSDLLQPRQKLNFTLRGTVRKFATKYK